MSKPMIRIHNIETDEVIDREMNDQEFAAYQADQAARQAILDRLGLSQEEANILLGGN
jgi:hypothetical protein